MSEFPKRYKHNQTEKQIQDYWQDSNVYSWEESESRDNAYVIDTPPPTVSGLLHMGHIFSYTHIDIIARYQRMSGKNVFFPMGFDDNGLPTERLVEKKKKIRGNSMPRAEFVKICNEVVQESEDDFRNLFKSIGLSIDWSQEYRTIKNSSKQLSQLGFIDLLEKQEAYRKNEPVIWDVVDQTALSQADLEEKEVQSKMNYLKFCTTDNLQFEIATTRPELLTACLAIFVHPEDKKNAHLIGKKALIPILSTEVPIIANEDADPEKGSGIVMCCSFGDTNDVLWWKKYKLDTKIIINSYGKIKDLPDLIEVIKGEYSDVAHKYLEEIQKTKIEDARKITLKYLSELDVLLKQEEITHFVKCAERSKAKIEILITPQWFIKVLDKQQKIKEKAEQIDWHPPYMKKKLDAWIDGLGWDWCISRQRFFGVPFPVWYSKRAGEEGKILVANKNQLPVDPLIHLPEGYSADEVEPETSVMDTWATSSLSPQLNSHGLSDNLALDEARHSKLYPADLRAQSHEIIRTWTFYTIVRSCIHADHYPWKNIMISGWCLASDKTKMSKSKGNVVTPQTLLESKGADAIRYWTSSAKLGTDIAYSEDILSIGGKLVNKLWNAAKFCHLHIQNLTHTPTNIAQDIAESKIFVASDIWILKKLENVITKSTNHFNKYEFYHARQAVETFFWNDFCDNYLEMSKTRAYDQHSMDSNGQQSAICTIYHCLDILLKLFAPVMPFVTEEIYRIVFNNNKSIHTRGNWPHINNNKVAIDALSGDLAVEVIETIRKIKAEKQLSVKAEIKELVIYKNKLETICLEPFISDLSNVINCNNIKLQNHDVDNINLDLVDSIANNFLIKLEF